MESKADKEESFTNEFYKQKIEVNEVKHNISNFSTEDLIKFSFAARHSFLTPR
jgi:hypothetical protein